MNLNDDYKEFFALLNATNCKYVIVGAHALAYHGVPRYTNDIDIFVEPTPANAGIVLDVLKQFGFGSLPIDLADLSAPNKVVQLGVKPRRIDLLTSIAGVDFEEAYSTRKLASVSGLQLPFLDKPLLIQNKLSAGRPQDLADVTRLRGLDKA